MVDPFYDFETLVAPDYQWHPWRDGSGLPVEVPRHGFYSLESPSAVEATWQREEKSGNRSGPVLVPISPPKAILACYRPMDREHAALFRVFAEVDYRSADAMRAFALQFGGLGLKAQSQGLSYREPDGTTRTYTVSGERFLDWSLEICLMREGIALSDKIRDDEDERRLTWLFDRNLQHVQGRLRITKGGGRRLTLAPLSLIAAMWLQLALAISGEKRFVACKFCRRTFEISTDEMGFRSHREFCSDSCKTQDYRKRKRTALLLANDGMRAATIAKRIETDAATVRAWLARDKANGRKKPRGER